MTRQQGRVTLVINLSPLLRERIRKYTERRKMTATEFAERAFEYLLRTQNSKKSKHYDKMGEGEKNDNRSK